MFSPIKALAVTGAMIVTAMACQQQATEQTGATEEEVSSETDVVAVIDESNAAFEQAMLAGNVQGMLAAYAPEAVLQPPMMPASSGTESIRALFEGMVADGAPASFDIVTDHVSVAESGELAYETGHYTVAGETEGETWEAQGKYLSVWEKDTAGEWKTVALSWSPNATPPAMEYAAEEGQDASSTKAAPEAGADPADETN